MIVDVSFKTLLESIQDEDKRKQLEEERQKRIKWEYGLYTNFCRLYGLDKKQYTSLKEFENYCLQANIKLV